MKSSIKNLYEMSSKNFSTWPQYYLKQAQFDRGLVTPIYRTTNVLYYVWV